MSIFKCEEMMCGHCVSRVETALKEAQIDHSINLEEKTVTIHGCEHCDATAMEILDDLGFTPVKIS